MKKQVLILVGMLIVVAIVIIALSSTGGADLVVGSKHFTEQKILGEMIAQLIENNTGLQVERKLGLQGTKVCFSAIREGELDIYPEYTGTGFVNILDENYDPSTSSRRDGNSSGSPRWGLRTRMPMPCAGSRRRNWVSQRYPI